MNSKETMSIRTVSVLEAAIYGTTQTYLDSRFGKNYVDKLNLMSLVEQGLLVELADKNRSNVAYKTTDRGVQQLLMIKSLHSEAQSCAMVEA